MEANLASRVWTLFWKVLLKLSGISIKVVVCKDLSVITTFVPLPC